MLTRVLVAIAITAIALFAIDWASSIIPCVIDYPRPTQSEQTKEKQSNEKPCTYSGGIVVAGLKFIRDMKPDEWTAAATVVIALFTTILGLFTVSLARSTRVAAQAAEKSADALPAMERAYLFVLPQLEFWDPKQPKSGVGIPAESA
jgi:hypothetical protein